MTKELPYNVIAFYRFVELEDPESLVRDHKRFFEGRDIRGRIYISDEGINAQMSASREETEAYREWLLADARFAGTQFKIDPYPEHAFAKMIVKFRPQLAAMDLRVDTREGGEHVSPERWSEMLDHAEDYLVLDVRNDYEWDIGHFKGAERPDAQAFRDFPEYTRQLKEQHDPKKTKVMMYCTGGIRCEIYSAHMKQEGFDEVYQLDGGVINYGHQEGNKHWDGKLFVFDDRMAVPISEDPHSVIGECRFCAAPADHPYNCANMDCNKLYLCCDACLRSQQGCCSDTCAEAERVRPLEHQLTGKPFRKAYQYQ
jgi:UPF0176 protein